MDQHKMKHLEMIQAIIGRLAGCSFLLKGWAVTLVAAICALSAKDADKSFFLIAYIPIVTFWALDGYFLWQEKLFRHLYDDVAKKSESEVTFKMDTSIFSGRATWVGASLSRTLIPFYLALAGAIIVVISLT
jgi:hypothetical protein